MYCEKIRETLIRLLRNVRRGGGSTMIMIYPTQDIMKFTMKLGCTLMLCARTQKLLGCQNGFILHEYGLSLLIRLINATIYAKITVIIPIKTTFIQEPTLTGLHGLAVVLI